MTDIPLMDYVALDLHNNVVAMCSADNPVAVAEIIPAWRRIGLTVRLMSRDVACKRHLNPLPETDIR